MKPAAVAPLEAARADPWADLRALTAARIALGRSGASLPTREQLTFGVDHALARDAVHAELEIDPLQAELEAMGWPCQAVTSAAPDRPSYLMRPDLGRRLAPASAAALASLRAGSAGVDLVFMLGDGLSATAVQRHASPLLGHLVPRLPAKTSLGPVVIARQARVALGDEVGERLGARLVVVLIGERPGLSSPDSLGAYLTWRPRVGLTDADRNCVSNIRPQGLDYPAAAQRLAWLIERALSLGVSGIGLKEESPLGPPLARLDPPG